MTLILTTLTGFAQDAGEPVRVLFYNVENLFDIEDDSLVNDEEFLPRGERGWGKTKYWNKINALYKVITAAGEWSAPHIVGLCEIENRKVLEDLVYGTNLSKSGYAVIHEDSPDARGIDVALLYRKEFVEVIDYDYFVPDNWNRETFSSREVLHAVCKIADDTIHVFMNHWPSRRGGVMASQDKREDLARALRGKVDSLALRYGKDVKVILGGDFNLPGDDKTFKTLTDEHNNVPVINLSLLASMKNGSYKYQGKWEIIDQIFVTQGLVNTNSGFHVAKDGFSIFAPDFMLVTDKTYFGVKPLSTWWGYRYQGGFSDHLPVYIDLITK